MSPIRLCVCSVLCLLTLPFAIGCKKKAPPTPPPVVEIITLAPTNVPVFEEWIGTLDGFVNAQIRAQVTGYLLKQDYAEGNKVKKGDVLFEIDPRPFQAALDQANAKLAQDQAQSAKTAMDVKRFTPLAKEQAISQEELDNAIQADIGAKAQVKADRAAVANARVNLGFTKVLSPVDGLAGTAQAQIGDLVGQSGSVLTTVSTIDPLKVYFQVSEESYFKYWRRFVGHTNQDSTLDLIFTDGSVYPLKGRFYYADRAVDPNTGTLQIFALFPNADFVLRPGQYGRVRAQTEMKTNALLIPQRAVTELQGSYQVSLISETNTTHIQAVKVGIQSGPNWIIEDGLKTGDRVVVEGTQKAKEGAVVNPQPYDPDHPAKGDSRTNSAAGGTKLPSQNTNSK
ncbi:MAG TPA: efflux RND transporter periplasmic adaptor subunit [Verrucomicrobiae bacterium]|nr:efflux RND transporter periplasmic adaptor subunit [Verrucomicrobiae bacterium]